MKYIRAMLMKKHNQAKHPSFPRMVFFFTVFVSIILAVTLGVVTLGMLLLSSLEVINLPDTPNMVVPTLVWLLSSLIVGVVTAALVSRIPLRPFHHLLEGMDRMADGDYSMRLQMNYTRLSRRLAESFNAMATELENTEMLRADFVNNFSHEFKTPIVSILGFAKLLKRPDLTPEKREEYLDIILDEAKRLTDMSDNVLSLARIEKQSILTDIHSFNVSEQIRTCVLLLQKNWERKRLDIDIDTHEYTCAGNEEMLKQVWINLLDNAVKFAPEGTRITIGIAKEAAGLSVSVANEGEPITGEAQKRIFEKFYQGDSSHATEGTGLGLAIARKIVLLHKGTIAVSCQDGRNVFTVTLPQAGAAAERET